MKKMVFVLAALALCVPATNAQYFSDNFDSYLGGTLLHPSTAPSPTNGGWTGWDNNPTWAPSVADLTGTAHTAFSGSNVLEVSNLVDAVQPFALNATSSAAAYANYSPSPPTGHPAGGSATHGGVWRLSTWIYAPSGAPSGTNDMYWIAQNVYNHNGPYDWILQTKMVFTATGIDVNDDQIPYTTGAISIPFDQWFQLSIEVDVDNQCKTLYLFDPATMTSAQVVGSGPLLTAGWASTTTADIQNLDLFTTGGTYYADDVLLEKILPTGYALWQTNTPDASLDCGGVQGTQCLGATTTVPVGTAGAYNWASTLANPYDTAATLAPAIPGLLGTPGGQMVNVNLAHPTLVWVNTLSPVLSLQAFPAPGWSYPFTPAAPGGITLTGQMLILNAALPDSFGLSQAATLIIP